MKNLNDDRPYIVALTVASLASVFFAILYFMRLSIFSRETIEWFFVAGLASLVVTIIIATIKNLYSKDDPNARY